MNVRVGFSHGKGFWVWLSWCISFLTHSPASHAFLIYRDEALDLDVVLEADWSGFRAIPLALFRRQNTLVAIYRPLVSVEAGLPEAGRWLGESYNYEGLFGMTLVLLGRALRKKWRNPFRSVRTQFCSEAVARVLVASHYPGMNGLDPADCDPADLLLLMQRDGSAQLAL